MVGPYTAAEELARDCGVANMLPNQTFAARVWALLVELGAALPEDDRPGPARGPWQQQALELLLDNASASLQGARQGAGKTYVAAIVICCHLLLGGKVAVAMPSLRQGSRILLRRTLAFMRLLEGRFGLKRTLDNSLEAAWDNGAQLFALSTNDAAASGTQGYTCRVVVIDEAHEVDFADLGYFTPLVRVAMQRGRGRLILLGVGGGPGSAIEVVKQRDEFACLSLDDATIAAQDDALRSTLKPGDPRLSEMSWRAAFAAEAAATDEDTYRQFFRCLPPLGGARRIFHYVPAPVEPAVGGHWPARYFAGIDVGRVRDRTVVVLLEQRGEAVNLVALHVLPLGTPFTAQARLLAELLGRPGLHVGAELATPAVCAELATRGGVEPALTARSGVAAVASSGPSAGRANPAPTAMQLLPRDIAIEVNGAGMGLYDILTDRDEPLLHGIKPVTMTHELKGLLIGELNREMRRGRFGVAELPETGGALGAQVARPAVVGSELATPGVCAELATRAVVEPALSARSGVAAVASSGPTAGSMNAAPTGFSGPSVREHLAALKLDVSPEGRVSWAHSDILSALLVARAAQMRVSSA